MNENKKREKCYITTPIYFPSGMPHLGTSYSTIVADVFARYKRLQGHDVMFTTGTDEHGQKIELNAAKVGKEPKAYVDEIVKDFKKLWEILGISYDKYIRTTDKNHELTVQKIFKKLFDNGEIYKGKYKGWYCTPCESFFTDAQLVNGKCPDCGREVGFTEEEAYFFKLSKYQDKLLKYYETHPSFIKPESRKNEMIQFIKSGLNDLCVSRTSFKWGIPVDFDKDHIVYVWLDALTNYITSQGYLSDNDENFKKYWPADVHFVGKEILRFHVIIWPAILMALDLPLPKQVFGHGWILFGDGQKMSKSRGNLVDPVMLCDRYGKDALRYFLIREFSLNDDGLFTNEALIKRINFDLANDLGNLLSRTVAMVNKYFGGTLPSKQRPGNLDNELIGFAINLKKDYELKMDNFRFASALSDVWLLISKCNKYIDETMPWKLGKDEAYYDRLATVLYNLCEVLRIISIFISPVMPETSLEIQKQIGASPKVCTFDMADSWGMLPENVKVTKSSALFPRIDVEKEIKELEKILAPSSSKKPAKDEDKEAEKVNLVGIDEFAKIKLKVAKVISCEPVKKSKKLLKLILDDGEAERTVASGISQYYTPEDMIGKSIILVSNLKPAKLCGVESHGMILAATCPDGKPKVIFVDDVPAGSDIH